MAISIETTSFDSNYHSAQRAGSSTRGFYVFHNVDVFNEIVINGKSFSAVYQAGTTYNYNDYSCPSNAINLSVDGGADQALVFIWNNGDFEEYSEDDLQDTLQTLKEDYDLDLTVDELREVYEAIVDNQIEAERELQSLDLSEELEDYKEDEASGLLELKEVSDVAFGRLNENGYVGLFMKEDGESLAVFQERWPTIYPINSGFSAHYEHPEGLVISLEDAKKLGISIEDLEEEVAAFDPDADVFAMSALELVKFEHDMSIDHSTSDLSTALAEKLNEAVRLLKICSAQLKEYSDNECVLGGDAGETAISAIDHFTQK